jgi:hypothetical protein
MFSWLVAISLLTFAISLVHATYKPECCGLRDFDLFPSARVNFTTDTVLELNNGWQPFYFGSNGTWALASNSSGAFYTDYKVPVVIRITDAFETGDRFALYLNGTFLGNTTIGTINSATYTTYPNEAWVQTNYSHGEWLVPAGLHRLTIKVLETVDPLGNGAFIRADVNPAIECGKCRPVCNIKGPCKCFPVNDPQNPHGCCANNPPKVSPICKDTSGMLIMIKGQFTRDQAIEACTQMNLRLAEINSANFEGINQFGFVCNENQVAQSWIRSWNGDNYQNACLVLSSGAFGGTGAINAQPCQAKNYALCQA